MAEIADLSAALAIGICLGFLFTKIFGQREERQSGIWGTRRLDDIPGAGGLGKNLGQETRTAASGHVTSLTITDATGTSGTSEAPFGTVTPTGDK